MKRELDRTKKALSVLMSAIDLNWPTIGKPYQDKAMSILHPAPAMEEVEETVGWVNVFMHDNGKLWSGISFQTKDEADKQGHNRIACQEIKVKVMRPVPQKVERSVSGQIGGHFGRVNAVYVDIPNGDLPPMGAAVNLSWEEPA